MMSKLIAQVTFKCFVECHECGERFDVLITGCNDEEAIADDILDKNTSNDEVKFNVVCPRCSTDLQVDGIEWRNRAKTCGSTIHGNKLLSMLGPEAISLIDDEIRKNGVPKD